MIRGIISVPKVPAGRILAYGIAGSEFSSDTWSTAHFMAQIGYIVRESPRSVKNASALRLWKVVVPEQENYSGLRSFDRLFRRNGP